MIYRRSSGCSLALWGAWGEDLSITSLHAPPLPAHSPSPIPITFDAEWGGRVGRYVLFFASPLRRTVGSPPRVDLTVPAGVGERRKEEELKGDF